MVEPDEWKGHTPIDECGYKGMRRYFWSIAGWGEPWSIAQARTNEWYIFDDPTGEEEIDLADIIAGPFRTLTEAKVHYKVLEVTRG